MPSTKFSLILMLVLTLFGNITNTFAAILHKSQIWPGQNLFKKCLFYDSIRYKSHEKHCIGAKFEDDVAEAPGPAGEEAFDCFFVQVAIERTEKGIASWICKCGGKTL